MDEVSDPAMSVLAEGHQWYWSYQYSDFLNDDNESIEFDSYMIPEDDLEDGGLRMLEVDNRVILPELTHVRFVVTAADVIHSFTMPSLGIKADAYPGRLNQVSVLINREGVFYGQCSEICGVLHSAMPIVIESVSLEKFLSWLEVQSSSLFVSKIMFHSQGGRVDFKRAYSKSSTKSTNKDNKNSPKEYKPESLALQHVKSQSPTTSEVINNLLLNQNVSISQEELDRLKGLPGVEFNLPLNDQIYRSLVSLVWRPNSSLHKIGGGIFFGVYIFKHIKTGDMYVGSSNALGRRLSQYLGTERNYFELKQHAS